LGKQHIHKTLNQKRKVKSKMGIIEKQFKDIIDRTQDSIDYYFFQLAILNHNLAKQYLKQLAKHIQHRTQYLNKLTQQYKPKFCKQNNCNYYQKFNNCQCFAYCQNCKKETLHIDRKCSITN